MPQITLEYTANVQDSNFEPLLLQVHQLLTQKLPTELPACKSRVICQTNYVVGNADKNNAFVHMSIAVLKGRSAALLKETGEAVLVLLNNYFQPFANTLNLQITVAVDELPDVYLKKSL